MSTAKRLPSFLPPLLPLAAAGTLGAGCGPSPATEIDVSGVELGPETLAFRGTSELELAIEANGGWIAETQEPWLEVEPDEGNGGEQELTVTVDRSGLEVDDYDGAIVLQGDAETSVSVPVTMRFPELSGSVSDEDGHLEARRVTERSPHTSDLEPGVDYAPGEVIVGLDRRMAALSTTGDGDAEVTAATLQAASDDLAGAVGARDSELLSEGIGASVLRLPEDDVGETVEALERDGRVRYASPRTYYYPQDVNDEHYELQWHYDDIDLEGAWDVTTGDEGEGDLTVAVIDGDFHPDHPDLEANFLDGWNIAYDEPDVRIDNPACASHGSHVAGTVAALTDNEIGVAGVAPDVDILPLNVGIRPGDDDQNQCPLFGSVEALLYAAGEPVGGAPPLDEPVDVVNMSLGGGHDPAFQDAVELAHDRGVTVVAAAGNSGGGEVGFPAAYDEAIAVSATGPNDELAPYSSVGAEVWVAAPGGDMSQPLEGTDFPAGVLSTIWDYGDDRPAYNFSQGTSMASPHVAGVAALMLAENSELTPDEVAETLAETAVDLGEPGHNEEFGHGRVDAAAAVRANLDISESDVEVQLYRGGELVAETRADGAGEGFDFGALEAGEYRAVAGNRRDGELGEPGAIYGEHEFEVDYDGDSEIEIILSTR